MPEIVAPDAGSLIVDENGVMTQETQRWVQSMTALDLMIGTGSPEGVIEATQSRMYMDDTGSSGSILYIKKLADIGGDATQGWVAV